MGFSKLDKWIGIVFLLLTSILMASSSQQLNFEFGVESTELEEICSKDRRLLSMSCIESTERVTIQTVVKNVSDLYVNITGDTMTGELVTPSVSITSLTNNYIPIANATSHLVDSSMYSNGTTLITSEAIKTSQELWINKMKITGSSTTNTHFDSSGVGGFGGSMLFTVPNFFSTVAFKVPGGATQMGMTPGFGGGALSTTASYGQPTASLSLVSNAGFGAAYTFDFGISGGIEGFYPSSGFVGTPTLGHDNGINDGNFWGGLYLKDNANITLGSGKDSEIYHNGNNLFIHTNTGSIYLENNTRIKNNKKLYFGTNKNASITWNNSDLIISSNETGGTGKVIFKNNVTFEGHIYDFRGWIEYIDSIYNDTNRLTIGTTLVNFSMTNYTTRQKELPIGITNLTWFNGTHLLSDKAGNSYLYRFRFKANPLSGNPYCEFFYNIGGAVGQIPGRLITFPKGSAVTQTAQFTNVEYTLDTWYQNGALLQIQCSNNVEFWDIELFIEKIYQGKGVY